jgi:IS1 family transposase
MFFEEKEMKDLLNCPHCKKRFSLPMVLPCGNSICRVCLDSLVIQNQANKGMFACPICNLTHEEPAGGFPLNLTIIKILERQQKEFYRGAKAEKLKSYLKNIQIEINDSIYLLDNAVEKIKNYFNYLDQHLILQTESTVKMIEKYSENLRNEIKRHERECISSFKEENFRYKSKSTLDTKIKFCCDSNSYLGKAIIEDSEIEKLIAEAKSHLRELGELKVNLDSKMFNNKRVKVIDSEIVKKHQSSIICSITIENKIIDSRIVNQNQSRELFMRCIDQLKSQANWMLAYRASADGMNAKAFHSKCDDKADTLTIIKTNNGDILGGYTEQNWKPMKSFFSDPNLPEKNYKIDKRAFIFAFISQEKKLKIFNIKDEKFAICCSNDFGPSFGDGPDLHIDFSDANHIQFGVSYRDQAKLKMEDFELIELEVFYYSK